MKYAHILVIALALSTTVLAQRVLERTEVLNLFGQLTTNPQKTWIPAGTITATNEQFNAAKTIDTGEVALKIQNKVSDYQKTPDTHLKDASLQKMKLDATPFNVKYDLTNESHMTTHSVMKFAGDKFYKEVTVQSRQDSVVPGKDLAGNIMTDNFNVLWNQKRIFAWDGEKFTMYTPSMESAMVDTTEKMPHSLRGEATVGKIPWGYGNFSFDNLAAMDCIAAEDAIEGQVQIKLTFSNFHGSEVVITLAPAMNYAVLTSTTTNTKNVTVNKIYSDYIQIGSNWVPQMMVFEEFDNNADRVLSRNIWEFISIDANIPAEDSFIVNYQPETLVEYFSFLSDSSQLYRSSYSVNSEALLAERLEYIADQGTKQQNCATAALKFTANQLGKEITDSQLASIVEANGFSSLLEMKQLAEAAGLHTKAVKTDIASLKNLVNCKAILYIPGKDHFVVLENADSVYVRIIDLSNNKFNYSVETEFFSMDWPDGVALLVSASPIAGDFEIISDSQLASIKGDAGYACTKLLQEPGATLCQQIGYECGSIYIEYWERFGCEAAETGSCSQPWMMKTSSSPCITDLDDLFLCDVTGVWTNTWMRACL